MYVKRRTGSGIIDMTQDNGTTWTTVTVTSSWTRVNIASTTAANPTVGIRIQTSGDAIDVFGMQHELGAFITSVIPTTTASATRTVDVASVNTQAFPYNSTEGTVVANFTPLLVSTANLIFNLGAGSDSNSIYSTSGATQQLVVRSAGSTTVNLATGGFTVGQASKLGAAFKASNSAVVVGSGSVATNTSGALPTGAATTLALGGGAPLTGGGNGYIRQITYLPRRVTNAELQTRTA